MTLFNLLFQIQPKKPGPFGYETPNFKCEKASETLYVTETEWTFDKKCYTVYKVQCSDGYDTGKVMNPFPPHLVLMEEYLQKYDVSVLPVPGFGSSVPAQRGLHLVKKTLRHGCLKMSAEGGEPPPGTTLHVRVMPPPSRK